MMPPGRISRTRLALLITTITFMRNARSRQARAKAGERMLVEVTTE
jgi:hypothetical protein